MYDFNRLAELKWLAAAFAVLLLIFGRSKGFRTIISLVLTCSTIFFVFIPAVLSGFNIYVCSIATCLFITFMALLIVQGPNTKSLAAALGCCGGLFVVSTLTIMMSEILRLSGLIDEDSLYLLYLDAKDPIHLKAIIFAAITIGAMGAILDIAVDIAASLREVHEHAHKKSIHQTIKSGITIGQDIVGSMSNTLILAYIGSSLSVILLLLIHSGSLQDLMNSELIVVEILQALAGSIGILFTIPLTSISCGFLYNNSKAVKETLPSEIGEESLSKPRG
nr:YibE/F family protein [Clostridium aminobutyricum]